uniref:Tox-SGS domain-containing protein n=1 Tax=Anopheles stephensi TaxID=30069 RepID=A0A182YMR4_ANOST
MTASIAYFVGMGLSLSASIGVMIGSGITFGYFALAASSGSWDPRNFDFSSPGTWNALLGGIATSAFIVTNPKTLISTFRSLTSTLGRALFVVTHVAITVSFAYLFGALKMGGEFDLRKWDFTDPGLYYSMFDAYITASFTTVIARNIPNTIKKYGKKIEAGLDRLAETEVYFRAKRLMRGDWSSKLSNARFFLAANAQALGNLQRGIIPIAFYTVFVTLRMADSYEKSAIPGFSVFLQILQTAVMTKGFTNRVVKPLMPNRINTPLALRLEAPPHLTIPYHANSSSGADCLRNMFHTLHIPFEWFFSHADSKRHYAEHPAASAVDNYSTHYRRTSNKAGSTIENCHAMPRNDGGVEGNYVNCYSHRSFVTIHPKDEAVLEAQDHYRHCLPLTYNGVPAISCDGQHSTLLAVVQEPPNMFAQVDGWLLLARVAPAAVREAKRIFQNVFRTSKEPLEKRTGCRESMQKSILDLRSLHSNAKVNGWNMGWFGTMLGDLEEDVQEYYEYGRGNGHILSERLAALYSDAAEEIELRERNRIVENILAGNASATISPRDLGFVLGSVADTNSCCYTPSTDLFPPSI